VLAFTNLGTSPCVLRGYPGVSYIDAAGNQLGAPADRFHGGVAQGAGIADMTGLAAWIRLGPGERTVFGLRVATADQNNNCFGTGPVATAAHLRIYPPDNTVALLTEVPPSESDRVCADESVGTLAVGALTIG
jgi:hypothetical protein